MKVILFRSICGLAAFTVAAMLLGLPLRRGSEPQDRRSWQNASRLDPGKVIDDAQFGRSIAIDGELALIGAPGAWIDRPGTGAAYVFQLRNGEQRNVTQIDVADATPLSEFGYSVALCGDHFLVGAPAASTSGDNAGAAYLYRNDEGGRWQQVTRLVLGDVTSGYQFGNSVALAKGIALIGAKRKQHSGVVYCFQEEPPGTWREAGELAPKDGTARERFGWPLAIRGDLAAVGAYQSRNQKSRGTVYLFRRDGTVGWKQVAQLTAPNNNYWSDFGRSITILDKAVLVGAPGFANSHEATFLFRENSNGAWTTAAELLPHEPTATKSFGYAVAMSDDHIAIGAPLENEASGAVYLFQLDGQGMPQEIGKIACPGELPDQWFGAALAISGNNLLVGARYGPGSSSKSGAAYLFPLASMHHVSHIPSHQNKP